MFAANYMRSLQIQQANEYFERGYKSYVRPEFKVWSETPLGFEGSANFLTGIGGFLQALIFGYGALDFGRTNDDQFLMFLWHNHDASKCGRSPYKLYTIWRC